jgi:hypothetical protein
MTDPNSPRKAAMAHAPYFTLGVVLRQNFTSPPGSQVYFVAGLAGRPQHFSQRVPLWEAHDPNVCALPIGDRQCSDTSPSIPSRSPDKSFVRYVMWVSH